MSLDPITAVSDLVNTVVSRIWPDANEQEKAKLALEQMKTNGELQLLVGQLNINTEEAKNKSLFVSGWRPGVAWVCTAAFAFQFVVQPIITMIGVATGHPISLPVLDSGALMSILMGLLGLGGMRSYEKAKGVEDRHG